MITSDKCAIGELDGSVIISMPRATEALVLDPETARQVGEALAKASYKVKYGREPGSASAVSQQVLARLVNQATHLVKKLQEQGVKPAIIANEIVVLVMKEVT
jgi:hypothetical protein